MQAASTTRSQKDCPLVTLPFMQDKLLWFPQCLRAKWQRSYRRKVDPFLGRTSANSKLPSRLQLRAILNR
jgi:hypothetical protein